MSPVSYVTELVLFVVFNLDQMVVRMMSMQDNEDMLDQKVVRMRMLMQDMLCMDENVAGDAFHLQETTYWPTGGEVRPTRTKPFLTSCGGEGMKVFAFSDCEY